MSDKNARYMKACAALGVDPKLPIDFKDAAKVGQLLALYETFRTEAIVPDPVYTVMAQYGLTAPQTTDALVAALEGFASDRLDPLMVEAMHRAYEECSDGVCVFGHQRAEFIAGLAKRAIAKGIAPSDIRAARYIDVVKRGRDMLWWVVSFGTEEQIAEYTSSAPLRIEALLRARYLEAADVLGLPVDAPMTVDNIKMLAQQAIGCPEVVTDVKPNRDGTPLWTAKWEQDQFHRAGNAIGAGYGATEMDALLNALEGRVYDVLKQQRKDWCPVHWSDSWMHCG